MLLPTRQHIGTQALWIPLLFSCYCRVLLATSANVWIPVCTKPLYIVDIALDVLNFLGVLSIAELRKAKPHPSINGN